MNVGSRGGHFLFGCFILAGTSVTFTSLSQKWHGIFMYCHIIVTGGLRNIGWLWLWVKVNSWVVGNLFAVYDSI